ncbi:MAG: alpha-amylase family glycosyl hydrolase [Bacteroidota bacterium]
MKHTTAMYFLLACVLIGIQPDKAISQGHSAWSYNLSVYEVNVRQYTKEGTFAAFGKHLDRLKDLGVGVVWFMPIHPIGSKNRLGSLGSYYSVKDYYAVNPEFGTLNDLKAVVDSIHSKGMHVLMDWVANHTAWDNGLTLTHPEWYEKNGSGNFIAPHGTNWSDVIQLDFTNQELRNYMIGAMKYWIATAKIDGFRCDAASFVPIDFWTQAITELKTLYPDIMMIAEDDGAKYYPAGFDITYAWSFYGFGNGLLTRLANGSNNANNLSAYVQNESASFGGNALRMYFTSNHDENSWYGTDTELFGSAAESFIAFSLVFRSVPLIYGGQETGLNHRLKFFDKDSIVWQTHPLANRYRALLRTKRYNSALWNGAVGASLVRLATSDDQNVFAFVRQKGADKVCGIFNVSNSQRTVTVSAESYSDTYHDIFNDSAKTVTQNYSITLPAWGYAVYEKRGSTEGAAADNIRPTKFSVSQNYPNPFNPSTRILYSLPEESRVTLTIFNSLGIAVANLVNKIQQPGEHTVVWNTHLASGVYFYRMEMVPVYGQDNRFMEVKRMLHLK